jgi:hypothetical protein
MSDTADVAEALRAVRDELARLSERVAALEAAAFRAQGGAGAARTGGDGARPDGGASDALLAVLGAAIAAYLGKTPRIRSVRVLSSPEWGRQGRLYIQASHALER